MSDQAAAALDALGDPTRRSIVERLRRGPTSVGELAAALPVGRPAVSKHLKVLSGAGLVEHRSVGTRNLYALVPTGFVALQQWLVDTAEIGSWWPAAGERTIVTVEHHGRERQPDPLAARDEYRQGRPRVVNADAAAVPVGPATPAVPPVPAVPEGLAIVRFP